VHPLGEVVISENGEAELACCAAEGDADAFSELYMRHFDRIYRYIYYKTGHVAVAEDLSEKAFLKAWEAIGRYEQRSCGFLAWLYRIAHNVVTDYYRTKKDTVSLEALPPLLELVDEKAPEKIVAGQEEVARLQAAIAQLPDEQQQVIILRFIEGIGHAEVAAIIGKSEGASRVVQCRALAALHDILGEER
jgi:RNA polymerase sigma-70 factor (ECF subfamily)